MKIAIQLFGIGALLLAATSQAASLTGTMIPPFINGWQDRGGACVADCAYTIGDVQKGTRRLLYFGKATTRIDPDKARWLVLDEMVYPRATGQHVVYGSCQYKGVADETLIALVKTADTEWLSAKVAYRANITTHQFQKIPPKGIRCANEGWGL